MSENLSVVRETFGKVVYTHKTYEKAAEISNFRSKFIKITNIILLTLTTGSALGSILNLQNFVIVTSILATFSLFILVFQYNFNYDGLTNDYKSTANRLWLIREKYQNFIADIVSNRFNNNEEAEIRDSLLIELNNILEHATPTFPKAYLQAQDALKFKEEMTFRDEEIDYFLPENLRIK